MLNFILETGKFGILGMAVVFSVVFILAQPGKEISFWGIKFHKRHLSFKLRRKKRIPKNIPQEWKVVFKAFAKVDTDYLDESPLFDAVQDIDPSFSELKIRGVLSTMEDYGLVSRQLGCLALQRKAFQLLDRI